MSTPAHIVSASYLTVIAAQVLPSETSYLWITVVSGGILDLDHVYYFIRDWKYYKKHGFTGTMNNARSPLHEFSGFTLFSTLLFLVSFVDVKLALVCFLPLLIHIAQDILMGKAKPFLPFDTTEIVLLPQKLSIKALVDIAVISVFILLWIQYLGVR